MQNASFNTEVSVYDFVYFSGYVSMTPFQYIITGSNSDIYVLYNLMHFYYATPSDPYSCTYCATGYGYLDNN